MSTYTYLIRRRILKIAGASFDVYDSRRQPVGFAIQNPIALKEELRLYADETQTRKLMTIKARSVFAIRAKYDAFDAQGQQPLGTWLHQPFPEVLKDTWTLLDPNETALATLQADSLLRTLLRGAPTSRLPQRLTLKTEGETVAEFNRLFSLFEQKMTITALPELNLNPLLLMAAGILLLTIERKAE